MLKNVFETRYLLPDKPKATNENIIKKLFKQGKMIL